MMMYVYCNVPLSVGVRMFIVYVALVCVCVSLCEGVCVFIVMLP